MTGLPGQDDQGRMTRTGMPGEGYQQRTARIRQPGRQKGENSQKKMVRT
jgi:hypothetical protein